MKSFEAPPAMYIVIVSFKNESKVCNSANMEFIASSSSKEILANFQ